MDTRLRNTSRPAVLIADDDDDLRDLMKFGLEASGYRVLSAADGVTALQIVHREPPGLIVLDVVMPAADGLSVCFQLRDDPRTAQIPVLMLSGRSRTCDVELGYTIGADDYMAKPFGLAALTRRVDWLMQSSGY
ncbi:response regulator [Mangrovihabitans endophyticus]|uniref:Response regulatory domain-containing protein n=1 Tax=Mangrovihabitans endophyticus TaxID=1751298 RepID=A0A8J3FRH8_9ACTN|nr:response regulator [Mangrovihabitans endophyticus]GGL06972.1 hypothetical protein GCM10012284_46450 [Mangrovihabitans endophyticus]